MSSGGGGGAGGGKIKPGVDINAKVTVRKSLTSPPQVIALKDLKRGSFIRTLSDISNEDEMKEDWARVLVSLRVPNALRWRVNSSAVKPLDVGLRQDVRAKRDEKWRWLSAPQLRDSKHNLLWLPKGVGQRAATPPVEDVASLPDNGPIITLIIAHRGVKKLEETGQCEWGFFANERFVKCKALPGPTGFIPSTALEIPTGTMPAAALAMDKKLHAFQMKRAKVFLDEPNDICHKKVGYQVTLSYELPSGPTSLVLAEGQEVLVRRRDGGNHIYLVVPVLQAKLGDELVIAFLDNGEAQVTPIKSIEGKEGTFHMISLELKDLPLVRAQGVLLPVATAKPKFGPGVEKESLIQLSPGLSKIREAISQSSLQIDLARAKPVPAQKTAPGMQLLAYNGQIDPKGLMQNQLGAYMDDELSRYVVIETKDTKLLCGHLQEIYVAAGGLSYLMAIKAANLRKGHEIVYLNNSTPGQSTLEVAEITRVSYMFATKEKPKTQLRTLFGRDDNIARAGIEPTAFANGILIKLLLSGTGGEGMGSGRRGKGAGRGAG